MQNENADGLDTSIASVSIYVSYPGFRKPILIRTCYSNERASTVCTLLYIQYKYLLLGGEEDSASRITSTIRTRHRLTLVPRVTTDTVRMNVNTQEMNGLLKACSRVLSSPNLK